MNPIWDPQQVPPDAAGIPVTCLPIPVRRVLCNRLDSEAAVTFRDYRWFGQLLGFSTEQIRAFRAIPNASVTEKMLEECDTRVSISELISILRRMEVGGVDEILHCWSEIQQNHYQTQAHVLQLRPGVQNAEGSCTCYNCQTIQLEAYPSGRHPQYTTAVPQCPSTGHVLSMREHPSPSKVSPTLSNVQHHFRQGHPRYTHAQVGYYPSLRRHQATNDIPSGFTNNDEHWYRNPSLCECFDTQTVEKRPADREEATESFNLHPNDSRVYQATGVHQGFTPGTLNEESMFQINLVNEQDDCVRFDNLMSQELAAQTREVQVVLEGRQGAGVGGRTLEPEPSLMQPLEKLQIAGSVLPFEEFSPPGDLDTDIGDHNENASQRAKSPPMARSGQSKPSSELASQHDQTPVESDIQNNGTNKQIFRECGDQHFAFPDTTVDLQEQTMRKMCFSTSEAQHVRCKCSTPVHEVEAWGSYPMADTEKRPVLNHGCQVNQPPSQKQPQKHALLNQGIKLRETKERKSAKTEEKERVKRNSDPMSSSSSSDLQEAGRQEDNPAKLQRPISDEVIYMRKSEEVADYGSHLGKFVFITGGEHPNQTQVEREIWKLCKHLHDNNINLVADQPSGLVVMPGEPRAVRSNLRQNLNEGIVNYFQKATCVIMAVSPGYCDYVKGDNPPASPSDHRISARHIYTQMNSEYCDKNFSRNKRFYPVMLHKVGARREHIPDWLRSTLTYMYPTNRRDLVHHLQDDLNTEA